MRLGVAGQRRYLRIALPLRQFEQFANQRSDRWFRVFNELPVILLIVIVVLVVVKPF